MSIRMKYYGQIGNCLFQYVYARMLAEQNSFHLQSSFPYQKFLSTTPHQPGDRYAQPRHLLQEPIFSDPTSKIVSRPTAQVAAEMTAFYETLKKPLEKGHYTLCGYFESSELYNSRESLIKSYFNLPPLEKNTKDIVLNVRLGDFAKHGFVLDSGWYLDILERETFDRLYIVGLHPSEPYLKPFLKYDPIVVESDPINDFHFIRRFDKIICSNSTYCWWAAFLSDAKRIYASDKWLSPLLDSCKNSINLEATYMKSYSLNVPYKKVEELITFREAVKQFLDKAIVPTKMELRIFVEDCLHLIFNSIEVPRSPEPYTFQVNVHNVGSYTIQNDQQGIRIRRQHALENDCTLRFYHWMDFFKSISQDIKAYFLKCIADRSISVEGNIQLLVSNMHFVEKESALVKRVQVLGINSSFLEYSTVDSPFAELIQSLEQGAVVVWFENTQNNSTQGSLRVALPVEKAQTAHQKINQRYRIAHYKCFAPAEVCLTEEYDPGEKEKVQESFSYKAFGKEPAQAVHSGDKALLAPEFWQADEKGRSCTGLVEVIFENDQLQQPMDLSEAYHIFLQLGADYLFADQFMVKKDATEFL